MLRVITMTAYRRPAYTRAVLAALAQCHGVADWLYWSRDSLVEM
jgi:hypothetical protein